MTRDGCPHANVTPWRAEYIDPWGHRGHGETRTAAGERLARSWATCRECGIRLERARVTP